MTIDMTNLMHALEIMGKGMLGIFTAIIIIMVAVMIMSKIASRPKKNENEEKQ